MVYTLESINNIIISVVNQWNWNPSIIDDLYFDDYDHKGIMYWFTEAKRLSKA